MLNSNLTDLGKSVSDGKTLVANAITAKGVTTATNANFATMASNIGNINTEPVYRTASIAVNVPANSGLTVSVTFYGVSKIYGVNTISWSNYPNRHFIPLNTWSVSGNTVSFRLEQNTNYDRYDTLTIGAYVK